MNKELIPYAEALALKELGFDEKCCAVYRDFDKSKSPYIEFAHVNKKGEMTFLSNSDAIWMLTIPTYSQAFRWFREKYDKESYVRKLHTYYYHINDTEFFVGDFNTYEEAELACLKKLIELIKNK